MKNKLLGALAISAVVLFASCDKEVENSNLTVDLSRKAPLKAYVYAELDKTKAGLEAAPAGTSIVLSINYSEFGSPSTGKWIDTVKVDANGIFSTLVPVNDKGVKVNIEPIEFEAQQVQELGAISPNVLKRYAATVAPVTISTSQNKIIVIDYDAPKDIITDRIEFVNIDINLTAESNNSLTGEEVVANQTITLYTTEPTEWTITTNTDGNGKFTATVPANMNIKINKIVLPKTVPNPDEPGAFKIENYEYSMPDNIIGSFSKSESRKVYLGDGNKVE